MKKTYSSKKKQSIYTIIGAVLLGGVYLHSLYNQAKVFAYILIHTLSETTQTQVSSKPVRIQIPELRMVSPVKQSSYVYGVWEIPDFAVAHWDGSSSPGEYGNVVMYAHNTPNLFAHLYVLKPGDEVYVKNANGSEFIYTIFDVVVTDKDDLSYILKNPKDEEIITLYTCAGFFDTKRVFVLGKRIDKDGLVSVKYY